MHVTGPTVRTRAHQTPSLEATKEATTRAFVTAPLANVDLSEAPPAYTGRRELHSSAAEPFRSRRR